MSFVSMVNSMMEDKVETVIVDRLCKYIEFDFPDDYAKDDYFHPSQLYYMCPRMEVYKRVLPKPLVPEDKKSLATYAKFHIGHALHEWYQNRYLGPMGVLTGTWVCAHCGKSKEGFMPKAKGKCREKAHRWEYVEPPMFSKEWGIIGKSDGILMTGSEKCVMDLKTSDPEWFRKMTRPWPSAIYQVQIYMWLLDIHKGVLVYIDKSSNGESPVKEFPVEYSLNTINGVKSKITSFRMGMEGKNLPSCACGKSKFGPSCKELEGNDKVDAAIKEWKNG